MAGAGEAANGGPLSPTRLLRCRLPALQNAVHGNGRWSWPHSMMKASRTTERLKWGRWYIPCSMYFATITKKNGGKKLSWILEPARGSQPVACSFLAQKGASPEQPETLPWRCPPGPGREDCSRGDQGRPLSLVRGCGWRSRRSGSGRVNYYSTSLDCPEGHALDPPASCSQPGQRTTRARRVREARPGCAGIRPSLGRQQTREGRGLAALASGGLNTLGKRLLPFSPCS